MKRYIMLLSALGVLSAGVSCSLDKYPEMSYHEKNYSDPDADSDSGAQYKTREDIKAQLDALYSGIRGNIQESGYSDHLIYTEVRADNAYGGTAGLELSTIASNTMDGSNPNIARDWNFYMNQVGKANQVICFIDDIEDPSLTEEERKQWKAEAMCWRAFMWYNMSRLWGEIPIVKEVPPAITSDNVNEVYPMYYPARETLDVVFESILSDLEFAKEYAPDPDPSDKFLLTKGFACGMLARVYAEPQVRDYGLVAKYCEEVEKMGYELTDRYGEMWSYDDNDAVRNTSESIFEVTWTRTSGNWVWMMFHRNAYNPDDSYTWAKWCTPSRNLIAAYEAEGDTERYNASIIYDECAWSNYYPSNNYAFMHKCPTNASSYILMRLGEIYLLHAEALAFQDDIDGALIWVNRIRKRAQLPEYKRSDILSAEDMRDKVLHERRLELSFEGHRFFDLVRFGKAAEVCDGANVPGSASYDAYVPTRRPMTAETVLLPVPTAQIDNNSNLTQNPGY